MLQDAKNQGGGDFSKVCQEFRERLSLWGYDSLPEHHGRVRRVNNTQQDELGGLSTEEHDSRAVMLTGLRVPHRYWKHLKKSTHEDIQAVQELVDGNVGASLILLTIRLKLFLT